MEKNKINARELAEKARVGRSFVYDILNGKSLNPTSQKLSAVAKILGVTVHYLMGNDATYSQNEIVYPYGFSENNEELISIPSLAVETTKAGQALVNFDADDKPYFFTKKWVENKLKLKPENLKIVFVSGDSMEPTLADGDMVLIDTARTKTTPAGVFVVFDGEGLMVKRLESISGGKLIRVTSDNNKYYSYDSPAGDINVVGKVVWFAREL